MNLIIKNQAGLSGWNKDPDMTIAVCFLDIGLGLTELNEIVGTWQRYALY